MSDLQPVMVSLLAAHADLGGRIAQAISARHDLRGRDFEAVSDHLASVYLGGHPLVVIGAAGIVIRALAPHIHDKRTDPPVLAVAPDGGAVVPLLGGHHGANRLAQDIAAHLGTTPALTTAGDVVLGVAVDAPPAPWRLDNPEDAKTAMAALLAGAPASISGDAPWLDALDARRDAAPDGAPVVLSVEGAEPLIYREPRLILGVGCARACPPGEMIALAMSSLAEAGLAPGDVASVHSIDLKADEAAVHALAAHLGVPARFHTAQRLEAERDRLANPSDIVFAEVGCHGVAEGAALAAAGPQGELVFEKLKSQNATVAISRSAPGGAAGRARGSLAVVGIGPGQSAWRTPEATRLIADADELVGYGLYIDLLGPAAKGKTRRDFALGEEEARCRYALEAAGEGRRVALICSGDGGIFAMGALVMELLDRPADAHGVSDAARRVEVIHAPGISALQAASARCGAILGHDFCAISLSDLLTPREVVQKRVKAAAEGDFVIAFYNPVSRRRRTLLAEAREVLLQHRPADCPVILASNLGRPDENLRLRRLDELQVDEIDMLTVVVVGASGSRVVPSGDIGAGAQGAWVYTARGYAKKLEGLAE
jgi:cobalt-precorrin 5A hydrolase/precorrin-3B C17-methyltransferase